MNLSQINVLIGQTRADWQKAIVAMFAAHSVNAMVAKGPEQVLDIIENCQIHTAILDMDSGQSRALSVVKIIHGFYPTLPCILLSKPSETKLLSVALELNVFSVISKPVDMTILREQLNRLFVKKYASTVFS